MVILERMKRRSTTPVSAKGLVTKSVIVATAVMMAVTLPFGVQQTARADKYDDQIAAYEAEIQQYQSQASALGEQVKTLQGELTALNTQMDTIRAQIQISKTKIEQLQAQIKQKQEEIDRNKELLGDTLANMYATDNITPLEMLAGSNNIADFVDQQEYRSSMTDQLNSTVDAINKAKAELEKSKTEAERVLADQQNSENALAAKEAEKNDLIAKTQNDQNAYNSLVSDRQAKQLEVMKQQQAAIEAAIRAAGGGIKVIGGSSGGYPWTSSNCFVDANAWSYGGADGNGGDGYGYGCRQCVSYVAWRVGKERGFVPMYWGNAYDWALGWDGTPATSSAARAGFTVSRSAPSGNEGAIGVITSGGSPGHVVWVESNNHDGTLTVAQYNYYNAGGSGWGNFSRMIVPVGTYQYFIYV